MKLNSSKKMLIILSIIFINILIVNSFVYSEYTKKYSHVAFDFSTASWYFGKDLSTVKGEIIVYHEVEFNDDGKIMSLSWYRSNKLKNSTQIEYKANGKENNFKVSDPDGKVFRTVTFYYDNNKLSKIIEDAFNIVNSKPEKTEHFYNTNSYRVRSKEYLDNDLRKITDYHLNGKEKSISLYENGKKFNKWQYYNQFGKTEMEEYYEDDKMISQVKFLFDNKNRNAKTEYYKLINGKLQLQNTIKIIRKSNGKIDRYEKYDVNGKLLEKYDKNKKPIK